MKRFITTTLVILAIAAAFPMSAFAENCGQEEYWKFRNDGYTHDQSIDLAADVCNISKSDIDIDVDVDVDTDTDVD